MTRDTAEDEWALEIVEAADGGQEDPEQQCVSLPCPYCHARLMLWPMDAHDGVQVLCFGCHATSLVCADPLGMLRCWILAD